MSLLRRPQLHYEDLSPFDSGRPGPAGGRGEQVEISVKYEGYIRRQQKQVEDFQKMESRKRPPGWITAPSRAYAWRPGKSSPP